MKCPSCQKETMDNARYCLSCGAEIPRAEMTCPHCSTSLPAGAWFCSGCGKEQSPPAASFQREEPTPPIANHRPRLSRLIGMYLFLSLLCATALSAAAPGLMRITSPVLCPAGYRESVVPVSFSTSIGSRKGTSMTATMYCIDAEGFAIEMNDFVVRPVFGLIAAALLYILLLPSIGRRARTRTATRSSRLVGQ